MVSIPRLQDGDAIAVFSPSSPATATSPKRYRRGKEYLEARGFRVREGSLTGKRDGYRSGTIAERVEELNALIRDPEVRCIMSAIGGMNSNSLLPYIDYKAFASSPKILIGYSDVTALLLGIYAQTGIPTFYGPALVASFGELPPYVDQTYHFFERMVKGTAPAPISLEKPPYWTEEFIRWEEQDREKAPGKSAGGEQMADALRRCGHRPVDRRQPGYDDRHMG